MVIEPFVRMGPPPRSLAAEANDCFMVQPQHTGLTEYKDATRSFACQWRAPLGSFRPPRPARCRQSHAAPSNKPQKHHEPTGGEPNLIKCCAVLAIVNTAARRLRRWPLASVDTRSARRNYRMQAGAKKRLSSRTKKLDKIEMKPTKNA
jgi:hypothetical protein